MEREQGAGGQKRAPRAVVVGGGVAGLCAALELRGRGIDVTVLEAADRWGGCVGSHEVAGLTLDSGAESFATRTDGVKSLLGDLGLASEIVAPHPSGAWVQLPRGAEELPKAGILGIPSNPWDPEVRSALGLWGSLRASLDRYLPTRPPTDQASVAAVVRSRMGKRVLERLVAPVVGGVHSADPELLDIDMVAPGLRALMAERGSLAAAVAAQRERSAVRSGAKAGSAVAGIRGGMNRLVDALVERLADDGVTLLSGQRAERLDHSGETWHVGTAAADGAAQTFDAELVVVALGGPAAVELLSDAVPQLAGHEPVPGPEVKLVTLVLDKPELDARPRGTGVLVAPQSPGLQAKALTHATAKWSWLAEQAGPGTHVVRLSYGRAEDAGRPLDDGPETDDELFRAALADASILLTVPVAPEDVLGWDVVRWEGALPFATVGHRERVGEIRRLIAAQPGLAVVGGWAAGNGLASVVPDARKQAGELADHSV
ncbi:protoporphyrinogen oxidase [Sinomonas terrae]|uniref:Coproporphyrinogen III oxidase n=1 Tax=Sinomonas terrae TaxID=2908838 RepID=A0ABS9TYP6_9MICC|nr:protoporphyrinogen oxidase [Sinomonas terrae]MCH6469567.1 protoporphyrinogen oxidase [Sinomonas terrae]